MIISKSFPPTDNFLEIKWFLLFLPLSTLIHVVSIRGYISFWCFRNHFPQLIIFFEIKCFILFLSLFTLTPFVSYRGYIWNTGENHLLPGSVRGVDVRGQGLFSLLRGTEGTPDLQPEVYLLRTKFQRIPHNNDLLSRSIHKHFSSQK